MIRLEEARGFIFDCDGTLLDSLGAWDEAERELFAQAGALSQEQEDEIHASPIDRAARILHERYGVFDSAEEVLAHLDGHLLPAYETASAMPGACDFVRDVARRGIPCVVLSSSPRRYLEAGLGHVGLLGCFEGLVTTDEVGASKQERAIYERALDILGSTWEETWAIDDAPYAIQCMEGFGLKTVGVGAGSTEERKAKLREHATVFVESLCDVRLA